MDTKEVLAAYCGLMQGIKLRTALMDDLGTNQRGLPPYCVAEILQLQVRKISETLAIACLLVHGDFEGARSARLTSAYQADFIMNALEKLHPRFYPRPTRQILRDGKPYKIEDIKDGFLTKAELLKSYRDAADSLHMGDINDLLSNKLKTVDGKAIGAWVGKMKVLLNHHVIFLADTPILDASEGEPLRFIEGDPAPKFQIIAQMATGPHGLPQATVFQAVGQFRE
jgi:hypothetical protein